MIGLDFGTTNSAIAVAAPGKVPLCGGSDEWTITDSDLLGCQAATDD